MGNTLERISQLEAQLESLKASAISELMKRRSEAQLELKGVEHEIERLTGKERKAPRKSPPGTAGAVSTAGEKKPDLQELKALLAAAPDKTISLRKEGYDVRNVKVLAGANPHLLRMGGKSAWPTVTLLK